MSEKWDYVPDFKLGASKREIIGELSTDAGYEFSSMSLERAAEVAAELRAMGERYETDGPTVLGWALQWVADDLYKLLAAKSDEKAPA